jgi:transposase-like protein
MEAAYAEFDYKAAKVRLDAVAKRIEYKYPSAAESIREGLEETLTLHRLDIPGLLRISLSSTNSIESALSTVRKTTGRVKHWQSVYRY